MMFLRFSMQEENNIEHIDVRCHVFISVVNLLTMYINVYMSMLHYDMRANMLTLVSTRA